MDTPIVPPMKRCSKCGEEFPISIEYWHKNVRTVDGLCIICKACAINRTKERYHRKRDEIKAKQKARYDERREEINAKKREEYKEDPSKALDAAKKYRQAHPEKVAASKKKYRQENLESEKEKRRKRYADEREGAIADSRAYYKKNKKAIGERRRSYNSQYNANNREKKRLWAIDYYRRNPAKMKAVTHRRLARKRNLPSTFTSQQWVKCLEYFRYSCAVCNRPQGLWHTLAADHWIALASPDCLGTVVENIIPLCHGIDGCNNSKGAKDAILWLNEKFGKKKAKQILDRINAYFKWAKQQD